MGTLFPQDFYVDRGSGETGRYYVTLESGNKTYLCHYGNTSLISYSPDAFSEQCYEQNKAFVENNSTVYPYYHSKYGRSPGCGPLPNVTAGTGEWACPKGVSLLSVPVYASCLLQCLSGTSIQVRCTEKLNWDNDVQSGVCSSDDSSDKNFDPHSKNLSVVLTVSIVCFVLLILFTLYIMRRHLYTNCPNLVKGLCNSSEMENNFPLNDRGVHSALGCEKEPSIQNCPIRIQIANSTNNAQLQRDTSARQDQDSNTSQETLRTSDPSNDILLQTVNTEASCQSIDIRDDVCDNIRWSNIPNQQNEWREDSECLPPFPVSNDTSIPLEKDLLECEHFGITRENVAFLECHTQTSFVEPDSCPTVAAMLDGVLENSVQFVDELSTLLDPDTEYKSPRNWQGLAQKLFHLPYNKIIEIRHKTKDHFKEEILPLLSCHGYTVYDLTYYFSLFPSRRVDVIECIQRYHPNCPKCGEIYNRLKPDILSKVS